MNAEMEMEKQRASGAIEKAQDEIKKLWASRERITIAACQAQREVKASREAWPNKMKSFVAGEIPLTILEEYQAQITRFDKSLILYSEAMEVIQKQIAECEKTIQQARETHRIISDLLERQEAHRKLGWEIGPGGGLVTADERKSGPLRYRDLGEAKPVGR